LNARSIEVHALPQDVIRCDATTVSGNHEVTEGGLLQGHDPHFRPTWETRGEPDVKTQRS